MTFHTDRSTGAAEVDVGLLEDVPEVPAELRERMNRYLNVRAAGLVDFDDTGRNAAKSTLITQLRDGKYVVVAPKFWARAEPVIPRRR